MVITYVLKPFHDKKWRKKILDINVEDIKAFKIVEEFKAARENPPKFQRCHMCPVGVVQCS